MARKNKKSKEQAGDNGALIAALAAGGIGLVLGLFAFGRRDRDGEAGRAGAIDRALGMPSTAAGDGGTSTADAQPQHERAPDEFRPDATATIPDDKRDAFAPATMPNPNATQPAM